MDLDVDPEDWLPQEEAEPEPEMESEADSESQGSEAGYSENIVNPGLHKKLTRQLMGDDRDMDKMAKKAQEKKHGKRAGYSLLFKYKCIMKLEGGMTATAICKRWKIPRQTLSDWKKNKEDILRQVNLGHNMNRKKMVESKFPEVSHALHLWLGETCSQNPDARIGGPELKAKADVLAKLFLEAGVKGYDDWKTCSDGWVSRWKDRHQVKYQRATGESNSADLAAVAQFKETTMADILSRYFRHSFDITDLKLK